MVSFYEEKYLKNKPPSPPMGLDKLPISVRGGKLDLIILYSSTVWM